MGLGATLAKTASAGLAGAVTGGIGSIVSGGLGLLGNLFKKNKEMSKFNDINKGIQDITNGIIPNESLVENTVTTTSVDDEFCSFLLYWLPISIRLLQFLFSVRC